MSETSSNAVIQRVSGNTMTILFNRPDKRNAITRRMYRDIVDALQDAEDEPGVKCVVFGGEGSCFTSGNDLKDFMAASGDDDLSDALVDDAPVLAFLDTFRKFPKPIIVAAQGDAVGIGTTLLLHADLNFASSNAHFSMPFTKLGLCPEFASSYLLPRLVGHVKAFEWLVLGRPFSAFEAHTFGLINAVVEDPLAHAHTVASSISELPSNAVREAKRLIRAASMKAIDQSIAHEVQQFSKALKSQEFIDASNSFFQKP